MSRRMSQGTHPSRTWLPSKFVWSFIYLLFCYNLTSPLSQEILASLPGYSYSSRNATSPGRKSADHSACWVFLCFHGNPDWLTWTAGYLTCARTWSFFCVHIHWGVSLAYRRSKFNAYCLLSCREHSTLILSAFVHQLWPYITAKLKRAYGIDKSTVMLSLNVIADILSDILQVKK